MASATGDQRHEPCNDGHGDEFRAERLVVAPHTTGIQHDALFKVIALGNAGVGKSSLLARQAQGSFSESLPATIGVDFRRVAFRVAREPERTCCLQLWDTSGQERYRSVVPQYYRGVHAILVVFDLTDERSFESADTWIAEVQRHKDQWHEDEAQVLLVGNKSDQRQQRQVSSDRATQYADEHNFFYIETSAKSGDNVNELFAHVATALYRRHVQKQLQQQQQQQLAASPTKSRTLDTQTRIVDLSQVHCDGAAAEKRQTASGTWCTGAPSC